MPRAKIIIKAKKKKHTCRCRYLGQENKMSTEEATYKDTHKDTYKDTHEDTYVYMTYMQV